MGSEKADSNSGKTRSSKPSRSTSRSSSLDRPNASPPVHSATTISRPNSGNSVNIDKTVDQKRKVQKLAMLLNMPKGM